MDNYFANKEKYIERRHNKYAIIIFLPQNLDSIIAPFRERFDPDYDLVASHITLVFPFETNRPLDELAGIVKAELENHAPILIELDSIGDFYPNSPIIYWNVKKNDTLYELYYRLYSRLGIPIPYKHYKPHVTIAREISNHRVVIVKDKIVSYLPCEKFTINALDIVTPLINGRWVSVRTFPFSDFNDNSLIY